MSAEFAFAFAAGLVAFFSPCSIALVPSYVALYLPRRAGEEEFAAPRRLALSLLGLLAGLAAAGGALLYAAVLSPFASAGPLEGAVGIAGLTLAAVCALLVGARARDLGPGQLRALAREAARGILLGSVTSLGFLTVFGLVGVLLLSGATWVRPLLPLIALVSAGVLVLLGALMLVGRELSFTPRFLAPWKAGYFSSYIFGIGYALISTGCLFPVFIAVLAAAIFAGAAGGGFAASLLVVVAYALGYAVMMVALAAYVAVTRSTTIAWWSRYRPHAKRVAGAVVLAMGAYIVWFDLSAVMLVV